MGPGRPPFTLFNVVKRLEIEVDVPRPKSGRVESGHRELVVGHAASGVDQAYPVLMRRTADGVLWERREIRGSTRERIA